MTKVKQWKERHHYGLLTFGVALLTISLVFIPFLVYNRGLFLFLGDYNVQQIPFYQLAHNAIREGNVLWNWHTDLGANFIGSYSFYLLFSPFFWLTLPFPNDFVPYLMAPLLILKTSCAAVTAYYFIKRFVKNEYSAVIGGILYAFSGFMSFNIFFNHFHEVVVFFPLLLISLEELVTKERKGFFALMVALNAMVNYWFFIGEVVFVILYVFVRIFTGGWGISVRKFFRIAFESITGVLLATVVLLPSVLAIIDNPRTQGDSLLTGWLMWVYGYTQRLPAIIGSIFFPPELPSQPNFFPEQGAKWASLSAFLPMFSTVGVIAYLQSRQKDFVKRLLILSLLMACIPILNSAFILFNGTYYARWFYMPILLMCFATVWAFEQAPKKAIVSGFKWTATITAFIALAVGLSPQKIDGELQIGLYSYGIRFWVYVAYTFLGLILLWWIFNRYRGEKRRKVMLIFVSVLSCSFLWGYIAMGKDIPYNDNWYIDWALGGKEQLELPDEEVFVRSDLYKSMDNLGMFWGLPNIQAFHSIIPASTMTFYHDIGIKRDVSSKPPISYQYLRSLLSVRWLFVPINSEEQPPINGFTLFDSQVGYNIYENDNYIPMGFGYTSLITPEVLQSVSGTTKSEVMLLHLALEEDSVLRNSDIGEVIEEIDLYSLTEEGFNVAIEQHRQLAVDEFVVTNTGFTAKSSYEQPTMVFFSVPYDQGWSAQINGEEIAIERANLGFMAVRVPAGEAEIIFNYFPPGLRSGFYISILGIAMLVVCILAPGKGESHALPLPANATKDNPARSVEDLLAYMDEDDLPTRSIPLPEEDDEDADAPEQTNKTKVLPLFPKKYPAVSEQSEQKSQLPEILRMIKEEQEAQKNSSKQQLDQKEDEED